MLSTTKLTACWGARQCSGRTLPRNFLTSAQQKAPTVAQNTTTTSSGQAPPPPSSALASCAKPSTKQEGTIASVFATLSGGSLQDALPARFAQVKRSMIRDEAHVEALKEAWRDVLQQLEGQVEKTIQLGDRMIPQVEYPGDEVAQQPIERWISREALDEIRERGVAVIKGVIPAKQALRWKHDVRAYASINSARGFPEDNPQVYELYWTKAQLEARGHPALLRTSRAFLSLFHVPSQTAEGSNPPPELSVSLANPLTYADRLRIRQPGDAKFALGPHVDGGGVERWECPVFRGVWECILAGGRSWREHDPWSLGAAAQRLRAQTDMYGGPGQCGVFRPLQGWLSMSSTRANEGTLRVLPFLRESTAYIVLRPFFRPKQVDVTGSGPHYSSDYLSLDNWEFDGNSAQFPGCSLGHNIELLGLTHPHLRLDRTMTSIPRVEPGDMVLWHCDGVHSVEAQHRGTGDSSVMYIPAIPTTKVNFDYVRQQRDAFANGRPPADFPGGEGESRFIGRGTPDDVRGVMARRAMALKPFAIDDTMPEAEKRLLAYCNARL
ncbi:hypothetical protein ACQY0O_000139 [Thecaphora frezii]